MSRLGVVTGAGTGVGRAVAIALAGEGWRLALLGRTRSTLAETAEEARHARTYVTDVGEAGWVEESASRILEDLGTPDLLVNAAGTNTPDRQLRRLSLESYHDILQTNLQGTFYIVHAFLPRMRERGSGTIVNIVSDAALWGVPLAGAAYTVSKFGQRGLTQTINAEENRHGIRACAILPGEIDTPLLEQRPEPPSPESLATMLQPEDVAACVLLAANLPSRAVVQELLVRPCR